MPHWGQTPEVLTQIGFEAKIFQFDPSTIIASFGVKNQQKHRYRKQAEATIYIDGGT